MLAEAAVAATKVLTILEARAAEDLATGQVALPTLVAAAEVKVD
jgi:hypothetical protein